MVKVSSLTKLWGPSASEANSDKTNGAAEVLQDRRKIRQSTTSQMSRTSDKDKGDKDDAEERAEQTTQFTRSISGDAVDFMEEIRTGFRNLEEQMQQMGQEVSMCRSCVVDLQKRSVVDGRGDCLFAAGVELPQPQERRKKICFADVELEEEPEPPRPPLLSEDGSWVGNAVQQPPPCPDVDPYPADCGPVQIEQSSESEHTSKLPDLAALLGNGCVGERPEAKVKPYSSESSVVPDTAPTKRARFSIRSNTKDSAKSNESNLFGKRRTSRGMSSSVPSLPSELFDILKRTRERSQFAKNLWTILEDPETISCGWLLTRFMALLILTSATLPVIQSVDEPPVDPSFSAHLQNFLDSIFMLEVVMRFYACPNRIAFFINIYNFNDLIAGLVPFVVRFSTSRNFSIPLITQAEMQDSRGTLLLVCMIPVLRLLKLLRRFQTFHLIQRAFRLALEALPVLIYTLSILVLVFSSVIFVVEPRDNISSLSQALWLTIVTVGTIGYGDKVPQSTEGTIAVAMLIVVSALYMAIPIGIVGKAFGDVWDDRDKLLLLNRTRLKFMNTGYKAKDIPAMFCNFDADGDGELTLQEFMAMMRTLEIVIDDGRVVELFRSFDYDGSGSIDDEEFVRALFPAAFVEIYGTEDDKEFGRKTTGGGPEEESEESKESKESKEFEPTGL